MKHEITNEYGRQANANQVKRYFDLEPRQHWPVDGMWPIIVRGITLYVEPLLPIEARTRVLNGYKRVAKQHRLIAVCPVCGKHVGYGRLSQHLKVHND